MKTGWQQPSVDIISRNRKNRDFLSWDFSAPVVSDRARNVLEPLIGAECEFLPLTTIRGELYHALNVINVVDCLDHAVSDIAFFSSNPSKIMSIESFIFHEDRIPDTTIIFKIPESLCDTPFVSKTFVDAVIDHKLTGAAFGDPAANIVHKIVRGEPLNVVPGILQ
jgi:hypothetical protein